MSRHITIGAAACVALTAVAVAGMTTATANASSGPARALLADSVPAWLGHAKHLGPAAKPVAARVYLAPRGGLAALQAAVAPISNPASPSYRHFVTAAQYDAAFEPTDTTVDAVSSWLRSAGLRVTSVGAGNRYVGVTGSVSAAQSAFGVSLQRYAHDGQDVQAPSGVTTVPANLSTDVLSVTGLDDTKAPNVIAQDPVPPPPAVVTARPCSAYFGQLPARTEADRTTALPTFDGQRLDYAICGYTGAQLRSAYEGRTSLTGKGVTVATTLWYASPTIKQDLSTYAAKHHDAPYAPGQFTQAPSPEFNLDPQCQPSGAQLEEALDLEAVHAMAPAATLRYYPAASCFDADVLDDLTRVVTEDKAQIVSSSWGQVEAGEATNLPAYDQIFLQGAMEGMSFVFASGDSGDNLESDGVQEPSYPASDPLVTAVGGTSTAIDAHGRLSWQTGWGTGKLTLSSDGRSWVPQDSPVGAGGGFSTLFDRPAYQDGTVPATAPKGRAVPDVAMEADATTGFLTGFTQTFPDGTARYSEVRIGGTSLASPLFAGMTALALQHGGSRPVGELNPVIYANHARAFTDVSAAPPVPGVVRADYANGVDSSGGILYSVRTFNHDTSLSIARGWDDVTGVGVPNAGWFRDINSKH